MKQRRILSRILFSIFLVLVVLSACNNPQPTTPSLIKGNVDFNKNTFSLKTSDGSIELKKEALQIYYDGYIDAGYGNGKNLYSVLTTFDGGLKSKISPSMSIPSTLLRSETNTLEYTTDNTGNIVAKSLTNNFIFSYYFYEKKYIPGFNGNVDNPFDVTIIRFNLPDKIILPYEENISFPDSFNRLRDSVPPFSVAIGSGFQREDYSKKDSDNNLENYNFSPFSKGKIKIYKDGDNLKITFSELLSNFGIRHFTQVLLGYEYNLSFQPNINDGIIDNTIYDFFNKIELKIDNKALSNQSQKKISNITVNPSNLNKAWTLKVNGSQPLFPGGPLYSKEYTGKGITTKIFPDGQDINDIASGNYDIQVYYKDEPVKNAKDNINVSNQDLSNLPSSPPSTQPTNDPSSPNTSPPANNPSPPAPTPTAINISIAPTINPSTNPSNPNPTNTPTSTPTVTLTPKPSKTPTVKPTPEDDIMVGIDFPILSTTESENDDNAMIARLDNYFDKAQKYALNNSYSTAAFSIQANGKKIDTNKYIRIIKEKFYSLVSSDENKPLKTYHQIKGKQVNMKHLVIIENLSDKPKVAEISGDLHITHEGSIYANRPFNHKEQMGSHQTKKIVIEDPLLVWYGRDEVNKDYIYADGTTRGRFGPYLVENGIYKCTVTNTTVSPNFILEPPTDTPIYFNTIKVDSQYPEYTSNGVPKIPRLDHIKERHMINFLTDNQYDVISNKINKYATDVKNIFQDIKLKNSINKRNNTLTLLYNKLRSDIVSDDTGYNTTVFTPKSANCFPVSYTQNDINITVKSIANLEDINDYWSNFTDVIDQPRAKIFGTRDSTNIETRVDNRSYGGYGTVSTSFPTTNKLITGSERKDIILLYYLNLVTNNSYSNLPEYLENSFSPHTSILLGLTTK